ncbi:MULTISPECIES: MucR family transcriptional regulator [unclassified Bradyrhizobium]
MTSAKKDLPSLEPTEGDVQLMRSVAEIVAAYVGHNKVDATQIPGIVDSVHQALKATHQQTGKTLRAAGSGRPAVSIRLSITPSHIHCLECGKPFQSLRRHLRSKHSISAEDYRLKWNLPHDYPMISEEYAEERSKIAKTQGLGTQPKARGRTRSQA